MGRRIPCLGDGPKNVGMGIVFIDASRRPFLPMAFLTMAFREMVWDGLAFAIFCKRPIDVVGSMASSS